jgi:hypothetical protein
MNSAREPIMARVTRTLWSLAALAALPLGAIVSAAPAYACTDSDRACFEKIAACYAGLSVRQ